MWAGTYITPPTAGFASGTPECGTFRANSTLNAPPDNEQPKPCERYEGVGLLSIGGIPMTYRSSGHADVKFIRRSAIAKPWLLGE
jgi:hypothetical protein